MTIATRQNTAIAEIIGQTQPNRSSPLIYQRKGVETPFFEYYVSGEDNACGFRALGFADRAAGIAAIRERLENPQHHQHKRIIEFIQNSFLHEDDNVFLDIFGFDKNAEPIADVSQKKEMCKKYVDYYAQSGRALLTVPNRDYASGDLFLESETYCSLMNALAYIQAYNLCVYTQHTQNPTQLRLTHSFIQDNFHKYVNVLYANGHFNQLVFKDDKIGCAEAIKNEEEYLRDWETRTAYNSSLTQAFLDAQSSGPSNDSPQQSPNNAIESPVESESEELVIINTPTTTPIMSLISPEVLSQFMHRRINRLPNMDREQSLHAVYQQLKEQTTSPHIEDKTTAIYGIIRLFLEHDYVPQAHRQQHHANQNTYIQHLLETIPAQSTAKLAHYGKIYQGRLLVKLQKYAAAYNAFMHIGKNYTQTFQVDLAALLLEENYVPEGFNRDQARTQGLAILNDILNPETRVSAPRFPRAHAAQRQHHAPQVGQPAYLNSREKRRQAADMLARQQDFVSETESDTSSDDGHASDRMVVTRAPRPALVTGAGDAPRPRFRKRTETAAHSSAAASPQTPAAQNSPSSDDETLDASTPDQCQDDLYFEASPEHHETAQEQEERLLDEIETHIRANILRAYDISKQCGDNHEEAIRIFKSCFEDAGRIHSKKLQIEALIGLGNARDIDSIQHYQQALDIAREINDKRLECQALIGLANARDRGRTQHYNKALKIAQAINNQNFAFQALMGLGNALDGGDDNIKHYEAALEIAHSLKDKPLINKAKIGIANWERAQERRAQNHNRPQGSTEVSRFAATRSGPSQQRVTGDKRPRDHDRYDRHQRDQGYGRDRYDRDTDHQDKRQRRR